jgi:hypothetical protein
MHVLYFALFLAAVLVFLGAAFRDARTNAGVGGLNLVALGLALATSVFMIQQARLL